MSKINTVKNTSGKELYNYQKIAIEEIFQRFDAAVDNYHLLYQLPTGGGKTVIFSEIVRRYISKYNMKSIVNSRPFVNNKLKKGSVNIFTENTNFRAFWYGTNKLMMNAIFFAKIM